MMKMKILVISAYYPPYHLGGYELRSRDIVENLERKGHEFQILVSQYGINRPRVEGNVSRLLHLEPSKNLIQRIFWDVSDLRIIKKSISTFKPDVIYLFHVCQLARTIFPFLARYRIPVLYDEGGVGLILVHQGHGRWLSFCESNSKNIYKNLIRKIVCNTISIVSGGLLPTRWKMPKMQVYFNSYSSHNRTIEAGIKLHNPKVIHSSIKFSEFPFNTSGILQRDIKFILPARIEPRKGIEDGINAIAILNKRFPNHDFFLNILGPLQDLNYYQHLNSIISDNGINQNVNFLDKIDYSQMSKMYQEADFCFLLTRFESFSRVPLEAMASGCLLICTNVGGNLEIVTDGKNGFFVPVNNPVGIADVVERIIQSPGLYNEITENARKYIENYHSFEKYIDTIEELLICTLENY